MNRGLDELKKEYMGVKAPQKGKEKVINAMEKAIKDKNRKKTILFRKRLTAAAAVVAVAIILPNTNASVAMAMENIPVIGGLFKVVTFRNYEYDDGHRSAKVDVPQLAMEESQDMAAPQAMAGIDELNKNVEDYTNMLIEKFEAEAETIGEGYQGLDITYDVVMDTADWFTLKIDVLETQASGYEQHKYYHIDKRTGNIATLKDLFIDNADYVSPISEEIKRQMRENMAKDENLIYFLDSEITPEEDFVQIQPEQNFYFNENGDIVIAFDEYEVAPGYMGSLEFVIPSDILEPVRKE